ncbi:hypothetical protein [Paucibacter soli]|uniref:hypothetical protein n=1 Tax=Paucibacter soli TaxID=3133433 RepID=UPI00309FA34A
MNPKHMLGCAVALLLSACGPGTGGTGLTSESQNYLAKAGAQSAPVCSAPWATQLSCEPPIGSNSISPNHPGTLKVQYASSAGANPEFVLSFEGNKLSLEGGCPRVSYSAEWGQAGSAPALFYGGYLDAKLIEPVLAMGMVQALAPSSGDGGTPRLQLELRNGSGQLLALLQLQRLSGNQTTPRSCP